MSFSTDTDASEKELKSICHRICKYFYNPNFFKFKDGKTESFILYKRPFEIDHKLIFSKAKFVSSNKKVRRDRYVDILQQLMNDANKYCAEEYSYYFDFPKF